MSNASEDDRSSGNQDARRIGPSVERLGSAAPRKEPMNAPASRGAVRAIEMLALSGAISTVMYGVVHLVFGSEPARGTLKADWYDALSLIQVVSGALSLPMTPVALIVALRANGRLGVGTTIV